MMQWIIENKEWVFSGVGVAIIMLVFKFIFSNKKSTKQIQKSGANSVNLQSSGNINIGNKDNEG